MASARKDELVDCYFSYKGQCGKDCDRKFAKFLGEGNTDRSLIRRAIVVFEDMHFQVIVAAYETSVHRPFNLRKFHLLFSCMRIFTL